MRYLLPLIILIMLMSSCGGGGTSTSAGDEVKEETLSNLELAADSIVDDCNETIAAWAEIFPNQILTYQFLLMTTYFNITDETRLERALETLTPKISECYPDSVPSTDVSSELLADIVSSARTQCEESCPLSAFNCTYFTAVCLGGDNAGCCWAGTCIPHTRSHCLLVCESSNVCNVPSPPPPPPPPD